MNPVDQTDLTTTSGNCFQACVASLLGVGLDELPHFVMMSGKVGDTDLESEDWFDHFDNWMRERGLFSIECSLKSGPVMSCVSADTFCILTGESPRGCMHAVVGKTTDSPLAYRAFLLVHDPHPSRAFFGNEEPDRVMFIGRSIGGVETDGALRETALIAGV